MKAILISIHPQWVELILNLIKKDEIRKGTAIGKAINKLIEEQGVAPMLIYCTKVPLSKQYWLLNKNNKGNFQDPYGKVVARFNATAEEIICRPICGEWECYTKTQGYSEIAKASCLKNKEIVHYLKGKNGTAIHINDLEIFDKPKEISEFSIKVFPHRKDNLMTRYLTRAPQSWCYIEAD